MTEERSERPRRPRAGAAASGQRPKRNGERKDSTPRRSQDSASKRADGKKWDRGAKPKKFDRTSENSTERGGGERREFRPRKDGDPATGRRPFASRDPRRDERPRRDPNAVVIERAPKERIEFPPLPENVASEDLHISVRAQLKTLSADNQEFVARHLQMVALLIDSDPQLAHRHALAASKKAGRIAVVRETLGVTAYTIGDFALALRELLTHRRISGSNDQLPLIIDCERGLGRPERGIEAATGVDRSKLEVGVRINLAVALSGARLDLGQIRQAQQELEIKELSPKVIYEQSPLLFRSYAEVLRELGRDGGEWDQLADRAETALATKDGELFELIEELELPKPRQRNADR